MISIQELNKLEFEDFIKLMGNIIEHCPVLTAALWRCRPFSSIEHLILKMANIVDELPHLGKIKCVFFNFLDSLFFHPLGNKKKLGSKYKPNFSCFFKGCIVVACRKNIYQSQILVEKPNLWVNKI